MERMCAEAARYGFRVFLLGGLPGAAVMAAHNLRKRYPGLENLRNVFARREVLKRTRRSWPGS